MKKFLRSLFVTSFFILSVSSQGYSADPVFAAPKMVNLQAVLVDDGGNVLYDKQEADIVFSVIDGDGETLYEEVQHVPIVNGAISVLIGNGKNIATGEATGGIPMEALIPDGSKLLRIKLNEQSIPQEDLQLVSVPYALYAESLSHPIESDEILDGTLAQADLSEELLTFITDSISGVNATSISAHRTESGAHPASSITVTNTFTHAAGTNLQQVLSGLDAAIGTRRNQEGEIIEDVDDEIAARAAADTAEALAREAADATEAGIREAADVVFDLRLDAIDATLLDINNIPGTLGDTKIDTVIARDTEVATAVATHVGTDIATAHPSGDLPTSRLSGTISNAQIADNAITASKIDEGAVGASEIASNAVGSDEVDDESIGAGDLNFSADTGVGGQSIDERFVNESDTTNWDKDASDDFTQTQADGRYVNVTSDTMTCTSGETYCLQVAGGVRVTGNLTMDGAHIVMTGTHRVDGVEIDVHNHDPNTPYRGAQIAHSHLSGLATDDHTQYLKDAGDTMTGNLSFDDTRCPDTNGDGTADPCLVDTVDVSDLEDRVADLEDDELLTDPSFNSVQITGGAPATPTAQTLYQQSLVSAWARVAASLVSETECSGDGLTGHLNISCIQKLAGGRYQLTFARSVARGGAMAVPSYAVIGNTFGEGIDDIVVVRSTRGTDFTIDIREPAGGSSDADFMVIVVGWNL